MKIIVSQFDFIDAFRRMERTNFSRAGLFVLFDYLEELERDCGEEHELDVIALCCDFAETSAEELCQAYNVDIEGLNEDAIIEAAREYLLDEGQFAGEIEGEGVFIYHQH